MATSRGMNLAPVIKAALDRLGIDARVIGEVLEERARQDEKWGEQNHRDVHGIVSEQGPQVIPDVHGILSATDAKLATDARAATGYISWADIAIEELAEALEAFANDDEQAGRTEVVQLAAVCVQWVEAIDRRPTRTGADQ